MMGHKEFVESGIKEKKGTLSECVAKKNTRTRFGIEFVERIGTQLGKT